MLSWRSQPRSIKHKLWNNSFKKNKNSHPKKPWITIAYNIDELLKLIDNNKCFGKIENKILRDFIVYSSNKDNNLQILKDLIQKADKITLSYHVKSQKAHELRETNIINKLIESRKLYLEIINERIQCNKIWKAIREKCKCEQKDRNHLEALKKIKYYAYETNEKLLKLGSKSFLEGKLRFWNIDLLTV